MQLSAYSANKLLKTGVAAPVVLRDEIGLLVALHK